MHLPLGSSLPNTHYRVCIKGIMFNETGEILLLRTPHGTLDMPGGGLDHNEVAQMGLQREIYEETGCDASIHNPICTRNRLNKNGIYYFFIGFACVIDLSKFNTSEEAESYGFFTKEYLYHNRTTLHRLGYIIENYDQILTIYNTLTFNI